MSDPQPVIPEERTGSVKTRIVATVGPACDSPAMLRRLVLAGVDLFRLNFAHGKHDHLDGVVASIRAISEELDRPVGILGDLSGPKIRLESLPNDQIECALGQKFEFVRVADPARTDQLTCTYQTLVDELRINDPILLADGTVGMRVTGLDRPRGAVICEVEQPGPIRSRQGINLPGVELSTPSLTDKDRNDLAWALSRGIDFIGLSFVRRAQDVQLLRDVIASHKPAYEPQIVAKIEKAEAISELDRILDLSDCVMVARGDLGVEVDLAIVPAYQKRIIRMCNDRRIPVITATQMLDSMERNPRPTRAEATDVANAVLDGTDAVMLSGETAVGKYPVETVSTMSRIVAMAERMLPSHRPDSAASLARLKALEVTEAVVLGAGWTARHLQADLIVVATKTGRTVSAISAQRPLIPILGVCSQPEIARRLSLMWGVTPLYRPQSSADPLTFLQMVVEWGRAKSLLKSGSRIVFVASSSWTPAGHDALLVHTVS